MSQAWKLVENRQAEPCQDPVNRRVALVTGGTDGIGRAVALELGRAGDRVIFVGRSAERGAALLAELNELAPGAEHAFIAADLALLSETARVAERVTQLSKRLDALVCCAGILSLLPEWTHEGLERNFVLNYLTRYLLVRRLLPALRESSSGRVVLVSNAGRYPDTLDFEDLQHRSGKRGLAVSGRTQFANDLLTTELGERLRGSPVEATCVFPGVTRSACFKNARGLPWLLRLLSPLMVRLLGQSPAAAARTPVYLARAGATLGNNGPFFGPGLKRIEVPARASNEARRTALWRASEELVQGFL
jgi:NAD(P)-dependent dehydrogenase (short-subunit alcohol dehydrogenase family)